MLISILAMDATIDSTCTIRTCRPVVGTEINRTSFYTKSGRDEQRNPGTTNIKKLIPLLFLFILLGKTRLRYKEIEDEYETRCRKKQKGKNYEYTK